MPNSIDTATAPSEHTSDRRRAASTPGSERCASSVRHGAPENDRRQRNGEERDADGGDGDEAGRSTGRAPARPPLGREKLGGTAEEGYLHCGPNGGGRFVKMVHNGIEYGLMAAYAEGLGVLRGANIGTRQQEVDAETTPLREPEHYRYNFDLRDICEVWRRGSVVASWLLDLTAAALADNPELTQFAGRVSDSGEGRWTIKAAIDEAIPVPVSVDCALSALQLPGRVGLPGQAALGDAVSIRGAHGEAGQVR